MIVKVLYVVHIFFFQSFIHRILFYLPILSIRDGIHQTSRIHNQSCKRFFGDFSRFPFSSGDTHPRTTIVSYPWENVRIQKHTLGHRPPLGYFSGLPLISGLYHGLHVRTIIPERRAKLLNMRIHGPVVAFIFHSPDPVKNLVSG